MRRETPRVAHRVDLRACAAIGAGCRHALRGVAEIDPTRAAIVRLGAAAAAELAAIPDTPELAAADRALVGAHPLAAERKRDGTVRQMRRLVERYRRECDIDRLISDLEIAEAYARCVAEIAGGAIPSAPPGGRGKGGATKARI